MKDLNLPKLRAVKEPNTFNSYFILNENNKLLATVHDSETVARFFAASPDLFKTLIEYISNGDTEEFKKMVREVMSKC
jgi:hypothetical protein